MSVMTSASVRPFAWTFVSPPVASRSAPGSRTVTAMRSLPKGGAEVTLSPISYQHDDTARCFPRDHHRRGHGGATRWAREDPLLFRQPAGHGDRLIGRHRHVHIGH